MKIQMIGHASIYVTTQNCQILMDPILWDPHQEGLFDIFPKREVLVDRLPPHNVLVISHRHLDHFDIRSLAALPKNVQVIIPKDPFIEHYLKTLGYSRITMVKDFTEIKIGATTLFTTRSENNVPEYGMVFSDPSGVFWNQVDSVVAPGTVQQVKAKFPKVDLLLAAWQPMLEMNFQTHSSIAFPAQRYEQILYNIGLVSPTALAPGANGFRYTGAGSWLNQVVFPVSRERFLEDVRAASPTLEAVFPCDPGDTITIDQGHSSIAPRSSRFVRQTGDADRSLFDFRPVTAGGPLVDDNPDHVPAGAMEEAIIDTIERKLPTFLNDHSSDFASNRQWEVIYQLEVVLPRGPLQWVIDFRGAQPAVRRGSDRMANVILMITGSSLYGLISGSKGWDYAWLGGYSRKLSKLHKASPYGLAAPPETGVRDPLEALFPYQSLLEKVMDAEVGRWAPVEVAETAGAIL
jgi:UDP-MurNAc hydroxylase